MGSRQTSTSHLYFVCVHTSLKPLTLTEIKKKALFYIVIVCWSKSWTGGHWVVHTQCFLFFFTYIYNVRMCCVYVCVCVCACACVVYVCVCTCLVWYVFHAITLHYYTVVSVHTLFKDLQRKISVFVPCIFLLQHAVSVQRTTMYWNFVNYESALISYVRYTW